ncbi:MAG TPA: hypothetical protein VJV78_28155 [Polyangiales bacterium]|nr:hypothetical protein [Polyangiales bacterium]
MTTRAVISMGAWIMFTGCYGSLVDPASSDQPLHPPRGEPVAAGAAYADAGTVDGHAYAGSVGFPVPGKDPVGSGAAGAGPIDPDLEGCFAKAKDCYRYARDLRECDALLEFCRNPPPPAAADPASEWESCQIKAKDCYSRSKDPGVCDDIRKFCDALPVPAPPAHSSAWESCQLTAKECYGSAADPSVCDALRKKCDTLIVVPPPPACDAGKPVNDVDACWIKVKQCYADGNDPDLCRQASELCPQQSGQDLQ